MDQAQKNKEFIINYFNEVAGGVPKTRALMEKFTTDETLIAHVEFFEKAFPCYSLLVEEITADGNRVIVRARSVATHLGYLGEIPPTGKEVDFTFVVCYVIENNMIVNHWMIADQMALMQQLGVVPSAEPAH
ncbi:MAG: ester cyclase [Chitinophagaceae bacterium]